MFSFSAQNRNVNFKLSTLKAFLLVIVVASSSLFFHVSALHHATHSYLLTMKMKKMLISCSENYLMKKETPY